MILSNNARTLASSDGPVKRINVNGYAITENRLTGSRNPVTTIHTDAGSFEAHDVCFRRGKVVYQPDQPLPCGAVLWIETTDRLTWREHDRINTPTAQACGRRD